MLLEEIARTSAEVAATHARLDKIQRLAAAFRRLRPEEIQAGIPSTVSTANNNAPGESSK
jgi:hypothetical protein